MRNSWHESPMNAEARRSTGWMFSTLYILDCVVHNFPACGFLNEEELKVQQNSSLSALYPLFRTSAT